MLMMINAALSCAGNAINQHENNMKEGCRCWILGAHTSAVLNKLESANKFAHAKAICASVDVCNFNVC